MLTAAAAAAAVGRIVPASRATLTCRMRWPTSWTWRFASPKSSRCAIMLVGSSATMHEQEALGAAAPCTSTSCIQPAGYMMVMHGLCRDVRTGRANDNGVFPHTCTKVNGTCATKAALACLVDLTKQQFTATPPAVIPLVLRCL